MNINPCSTNRSWYFLLQVELPFARMGWGVRHLSEIWQMLHGRCKRYNVDISVLFTGRIQFKVQTILAMTNSSLRIHLSPFYWFWVWVIPQVAFNSRYWLHCHSNLRISRTEIENLKWQIGRDINHVAFGKLITLLVQKLKIDLLGVYKNCTLMY